MTPELDAGGVEQATLDVARAAAAAGARSLVASRGGALEHQLAADGARLIPMSVHSKDPLIIAINAVRLAALVRRERVSLIHVRSRAPAFSALWASSRTGVPMVAGYHGIYSAGWAGKRWYNGVMTRGALTLANSTFTRDHILAEHPLAPDKVVVIPEGVDLAVFDPDAVGPERIADVRAGWGLAATDRRAVVLLAGRLTRLKGHLLLIQALAALPGKDKVVAIFAGGGGRDDYRAEVQAAARAAGVDARLTGPCADMPAAYLAAALLAAPSTQPETFGRTVVEAAAMGTLVLAAAHGGPAETVAPGETGWLVAPGEPAAWTAALTIALAVKPKARAAMAANARQRAKRLYSLDAMCDATFAVYRRVLEGRA